VHVHFTGYAAKFDEVIPVHSPRLSAWGVHTRSKCPYMCVPTVVVLRLSRSAIVRPHLVWVCVTACGRWRRRLLWQRCMSDHVAAGDD
jgi:hypothetical protein